MGAHCNRYLKCWFWIRCLSERAKENLKIEKLELILLALPKIQDIKNITLQLRHANYQGKIAAIARFDDERREIETYGVDKVFNFYNEAGVGFAEESLAIMKH